MGHAGGTCARARSSREGQEPRFAIRLLFPGFRLDVFLLSPPALPVIGDLLRYTISPWVGRLIWPLILKKLFGPSPVPKRFPCLSHMDGAAPVSASRRRRGIRAHGPGCGCIATTLQRTEVACVYHRREDDRIVNPHRQSARLHDSIPQSEFRLMAGVGHMVHHTACDQVMDLIEQAAGSSSSPTEPAHSPHSMKPHRVVDFIGL